MGFVQPQPITPGGYGRDSHWVGELNSMPAKISFPLGICYPQSGEAMNKAGCPIAAAASQGRLSCAWLPGPGPAAPSRTSRGVSESQSRSTSPTAKDPGAEGQGPGWQGQPRSPLRPAFSPHPTRLSQEEVARAATRPGGRGRCPAQFSERKLDLWHPGSPSPTSLVSSQQAEHTVSIHTAFTSLPARKTDNAF